MKDLDTRISDIEDERRLADAAHRATTTRLRELRQAGADRDQTRDLRTQQNIWMQLRGELEAAVAALFHPRELRASLAEVDRQPRLLE